jgi:hypothetical protein
MFQVTFEVLMATNMNMAIFWDVAPFSHHQDDGGSKLL